MSVVVTAVMMGFGVDAIAPRSRRWCGGSTQRRETKHSLRPHRRRHPVLALAGAASGGGARQGLDLVYKLIDLDVLRIARGAAPGCWRRRARRATCGLNITFPCKQAVMPLLHGLSDEARAIGAVNHRGHRREKLTGHNTDASGWAWASNARCQRVDLSRVVLLGAAVRAPRSATRAGG